MSKQRDTRSKSQKAWDALNDFIKHTEEDGKRWELRNALQIQKV